MRDGAVEKVFQRCSLIIAAEHQQMLQGRKAGLDLRTSGARSVSVMRTLAPVRATILLSSAERYIELIGVAIAPISWQAW
jgi:hypothetical protein